MQSSAGSFLARSFEALGSAAGFLLRTTLLGYGPLLLLFFVLVERMEAPVADQPAGAALGCALMPLLLVLMAGLALVYVAQIWGMVETLRGHRPGVLESLGVAARSMIVVIGVGILSGLAVLGGLLLLVVPGIIAYCGLFVAFPAVLFENRGPLEALRSSWELTRGHRLSIFLAAAAFAIGGQILQHLLGGVGETLGELAWIALALDVVTQVAVALLQIALVAVVYHDLRQARGDFADEELAAVFA